MYFLDDVNDGTSDNVQQFPDVSESMGSARKCLEGSNSNEERVKLKSAQNEERNACGKESELVRCTLCSGVLKAIKASVNHDALNTNEETNTEPADEQEVYCSSTSMNKGDDADSDSDPDVVEEKNNIAIYPDTDDSEQDLESQENVVEVDKHITQASPIGAKAQLNKDKRMASDVVNDRPAPLESEDSAIVPTPQVQSSGAAEYEVQSSHHFVASFAKLAYAMLYVLSSSTLQMPHALISVGSSGSVHFLSISVTFSSLTEIPGHVAQLAAALCIILTMILPLLTGCIECAQCLVATLWLCVSQFWGPLLEAVKKGWTEVLNPIMCPPSPPQEPIKAHDVPEKEPHHTPVIPVAGFEEMLQNLIPTCLKEQHCHDKHTHTPTLSENCTINSQGYRKSMKPSKETIPYKACAGGNKSSSQTTSNSPQTTCEHPPNHSAASNTHHQSQPRKSCAGGGGGGEDPRRPRGKEPPPAHYNEPFEPEGIEPPDEQDGANTSQEEQDGSSEEATVKSKDPECEVRSGPSKTNNSRSGHNSSASFNRQTSSKHTTESEAENDKNPDHLRPNSEKKCTEEEVDPASLTEPSEGSQNLGREAEKGMQESSVQPKKSSAKPTGERAKSQRSPHMQCSPLLSKSTCSLKRRKKKSRGHRRKNVNFPPHKQHNQPYYKSTHCSGKGKGKVKLKAPEKTKPAEHEWGNETAQRCTSPTGQSATPLQLEVNPPIRSGVFPANTPEQESEQACRFHTKSKVLATAETGREPHMYRKRRSCVHSGLGGGVVSGKHTTESESESGMNSDSDEKECTEAPSLTGLSTEPQDSSGEREFEVSEQTATSHSQVVKSEILPKTKLRKGSRKHRKKHSSVDADLDGEFVSDDKRADESPCCEVVEQEGQGERQYIPSTTENVTTQEPGEQDNGCRPSNSEQEEKRTGANEHSCIENASLQSLSSSKHDLTYQLAGVQGEVSTTEDKGSHQQHSSASATENWGKFPHPRKKSISCTGERESPQQHKQMWRSGTSCAINSGQPSKQTSTPYLQTRRSQVVLTTEQEGGSRRRQQSQSDPERRRVAEGSNVHVTRRIPVVEQHTRKEVTGALNTRIATTQPRSSCKSEVTDQGTGGQADGREREDKGSHLEPYSSADSLRPSYQHSRANTGTPTTTLSDGIPPHQSRTSSGEVPKETQEHTSIPLLQAGMSQALPMAKQERRSDQGSDGEVENIKEDQSGNPNTRAVDQEAEKETEDEVQSKVPANQKSTNVPKKLLLLPCNECPLGHCESPCHHPEGTARKDILQQHIPSTQQGMKPQFNKQAEARREPCVPGQGVEPHSSQPVVAVKCGVKDGRMTGWRARSTREENRWHTPECIPGNLGERITGLCQDRHERHTLLPHVSACLRPLGTPKGSSCEMHQTVSKQPTRQHTRKKAGVKSSSGLNASTHTSTVSPSQSGLHSFWSVPPTPQSQPDVHTNDASSPLEATAKGGTSQIVNVPEPAQMNETHQQHSMTGYDDSNKPRDMAFSTQATYSRTQHSRPLYRAKERKKRRLKRWQRRRNRPNHQRINLRALHISSAHVHRDHFGGSHELVGSTGILPSVELSPPTLLPQPSTTNCAAASEMVVGHSLHSESIPPLATSRRVVGTAPISQRRNRRHCPVIVSGCTHTEPCPGTNIALASYPVQEHAPVTESLGGQYTCTREVSVQCVML